MIELILICAILFGVYLKTSSFKSKNYPPGPFPLPLIGNFFDIDFQNPQNSWKVLVKKYGNVVGLKLPSLKAVVISGHEAIKEIMLNDDFAGRPFLFILNDLSPDGKKYGLIFIDGPEWRIQKRFILHHFRNLGFGKKSHEGIILDEIENLISELEDLKGTPTSLTQPKLAMSAINIVWCIIGGKRFQRSDPRLQQLATAIGNHMRIFKITGGPVVVAPFLKHIFPNQTGYTAFFQSKNEIDKFVKESIQDHENQNIDANDFIGIYLNEIKKASDPSFSINQLMALCRDLLLAGSDTSSQTTSFAILFSCLYPDMQDKMYQEIQNVVGKDRLPSVEDRSELIYVCAFINEIMRFRTISPTIIPHRNVTDVKLQGYTITKDTIIFMNFESILMDKEYWGDPENFRPERFISEEGKLMKEERLINFGKGKRVCAGENLGKFTVFLILTSLIQKFHIHFPEGQAPKKNIEAIPGFTFGTPEVGIIFTPRNSQTL